AALVETAYTWALVGDFSFDIAFYFDRLSALMTLIVTGVGTLIHIYSTGYMKDDASYARYFAYLNLFLFFMLLLVLGRSLLVCFVGWEGVGLASYLLIGFWFEDPAKAAAGKKAFITNRIGDAGFLLGMFLIYHALGTLDFDAVNAAFNAPVAPAVSASLVGLLLFIGATGKSAQIPLHVWLPDAMAGPTPVSALIHAATMVTAGVFLMTRVNPVLAVSYDWAPTLIAIVGVATALFAATIAVAPTDIKKVLAYSTVSQLGFMFLAVGSGAYVAAIFHMVTHAFFKALLFLGSGSVIHGMHHEQDMRRMGALRKLMPVTAFTFIIGWLAIAGVPPFAGFWSKDEILLFAFAKSPILYVVGMITALLTAYYMTRQVIMVFFGEARWNDHSEEHGAHGDFKPHESPRIMLLPLVVLAGLSVVGGAMQLPFTKDLHFLEKWLEPVIEFGEADIHHSWAYENKYILLGIAIVVAISGILLSAAVYAKKKIAAIEPALLADGWKYDKAITSFMGGPGRRAFDGVAWADRTIVDGAVNGVGRLVQGAGGFLRKGQTGAVRNYAAAVGLGVVALLVWFFLRGVVL
ncbi:MAG: NADH-quinone oxidoreductase subunit L, partial [Actinomycetes bacterium]